MLRARQNSSGFSLIEVLAALFIVSVAVSAALGLMSGSLRGVSKTSNYSRALVHAHSMMEESLAVSNPTELDETVEFEGNFMGMREVHTPSVDNQVVLYEISITVQWPPSGSLSLVAYSTRTKDE